MRALQAGYEKDLMGFVAFGVPTMEHLLANLMEQEGVVTAPTTRREEPASMQWALEKEEVRTRLGKDRVFELDLLYCAPHGEKLRHGHAHGLLADRNYTSVGALYAWWAACRLIRHLGEEKETVDEPRAEEPGMVEMEV